MQSPTHAHTDHWINCAIEKRSAWTSHGPVDGEAGAIRWAIIRIDECNFEEIVLVTSNIPDDLGFYSGVVQRYDLTTGSWISQFPCKVLDANR